MKNEGPSPHLQLPAICPYLKTDPSSPSPPPQFPFPDNPSSFYPPIYAWVFEVVFSLKFPYQNPIYTSPPPLPMHATSPTHLILLNFITWTVFGEDYRSLCSFLHSLFTSSLLGPNILLSTLFSNILSLCSSLNVSDQVSHTHTKQQAKL